MWIGSSRNNKSKPFGIEWPHEPIKALGVYYSYDSARLWEKNFIENLYKIKKNSWSYGPVEVYHFTAKWLSSDFASNKVENGLKKPLLLDTLNWLRNVALATIKASPTPKVLILAWYRKLTQKRSFGLYNTSRSAKSASSPL